MFGDESYVWVSLLETQRQRGFLKAPDCCFSLNIASNFPSDKNELSS